MFTPGDANQLRAMRIAVDAAEIIAAEPDEDLSQEIGPTLSLLDMVEKLVDDNDIAEERIRARDMAMESLRSEIATSRRSEEVWRKTATRIEGQLVKWQWTAMIFAGVAVGALLAWAVGRIHG